MERTSFSLRIRNSNIDAHNVNNHRKFQTKETSNTLLCDGNINVNSINNTERNPYFTSSLSNLLCIILCVWFFSGGNINGVRARYSIIVFPET